MTLPKGNTELSRDTRPIAAVWFERGEGGWRVDDNGCAKIEAYDENGSMANVPWVAIYNHDGVIVSRIPAGMLSIVYE